MKDINILFLGLKEWPPYSIPDKGKKKGGGLGKYCEILFSNLPKYIRISIITRKGIKQKKYEEIENLNIYRISSYGPRKANILIFNILSFFKAINIIRIQKIDIIHSHIIFAIFGGYYLGKIFNLPVVGTPHGVPYGAGDTNFKWKVPKAFFKISKFIETNIYPHVDKLILSSDNDYKRLLSYTNKKYDNSKIILTGIDIKDENINQNTKTFEIIRLLYVGRIWTLKGIDNLIEAISLLDNLILERIVLDIVGGGEDTNEFRDSVKKHNLESKIIFHGYVPSTEVFFKNADIFILPSYSESFSVALLEAMSYGLACIVNSMASPIQGDYAEILENNSPTTISKAIQRLVLNPALICKYKKRSKLMVESEFSKDQFISKHIVVYKKILGNQC
jgi:glycosyltransferase involved in cell wall biosynthesis